LGKVLKVLNKHGLLLRNIVVHHEGNEEVSFILADMIETINSIEVVSCEAKGDDACLFVSRLE
jgi:hypothetical protein